MAYYSFGLPAVICQVLFILSGFLFILVRVFRLPDRNRDQKIAWQALLMNWCTYTLWTLALALDD